MKPYMKVTEDRTKEINDIVKKFEKDTVLVGIPESKGSREDTDEITNAQLLAITQFGSPAQNIPEWNVMGIGIRSAQKDIADQYKQAAVNAFSQGLGVIDVYENRVGIIASNAIKSTITNQVDAPELSEGTLKARAANGFKGKKRAIVTAQMRNAITYVLRSGNKKAG